MKINIDEEKEYLKEMLVEIKEICDANGIMYFLGGGTLLGAVRHKGFIPWDDDIDIMLPRKDYEKLIEVFNKQTKKAYKLLYYKNCKGYYYTYAKIVCENTILEENNFEPIKEMGIYIDVFPIDYLPDNEQEIKKTFKEYNKYYKLLNFYKIKDHSVFTNNKLKIFIKNSLKKVLKKEKIIYKIVDKINKVCTKYMDTNTVACITGRYQEKEIMNKDYMDGYVEVEFEGVKYKAPKGYDEYLKKHYGKYMELPPKEQQIAAHDTIIFTREEKYNVLLCGLKYNNNYGDPIINDSCKYLVKKNIEKAYNIEEIDLEGKKNFTEKYKINNFINIMTKINTKIFNILKKIANKTKMKKMYNYLDYISWYFTDEYKIFNKYYNEKIKKADIIIFVGGGMIKYRYQNCYHYIDYVTKIADKNNIPVYLNAVGVEGYNEKNIKSRKLKKALNRKCIKMITTRDDLETLQKYIDNNEIYINRVSDPAVYVNEVYKISKNENSEEIGLGVCRGSLFFDNKINFSEEQLIKLWKNIINELENKGYSWRIYTNGLNADNVFAEKLIKVLKLDESKILIPKSPIELVKIISNFKGIIATRLHSNIIAYSLHVPAIGLVWNNKLKMFGKSIMYPERFFEKENFEAKKIVSELEKALKEEYQKIEPETYRKSDEEAIRNFLQKNIK